MIKITRMFRATARQGFTLVEILVVLILMSLILGISAAFFANTLPKARQQTAAREIAATIKYARNLAASKNEPQTVTFDLDKGLYGIKGRIVKTLPDEIKVMIYESGINATPVQNGQYGIDFDSSGLNDWDKIKLIRGDKIITIRSDPVYAAIIDDDQDEQHE